MPKRTVPETSKEAFLSLDERKLSDMHLKIVYAISQLREATTSEVSSFLKIDYHVIQKRFNEVEKKGIIIKTTNKRPLKSGALGFTYVLAEPVQTDKQMQYIKSMVEPAKPAKQINGVSVQQANLFT